MICLGQKTNKANAKVKFNLSLNEGISVLYPGSATHVGVAQVFGKDYTIHVDPEKAYTGVLQKAGYTAITSTIEAYSPEAIF